MEKGHTIIEEIWRDAGTVSIGSNLSEERLLALSRIHLSLHTLTACVRSAGVSEARTRLQHRLAVLFEEWCRRCRLSADKLKVGRYVPLLYRLAMPCLLPTDSGRLMKCDAVAGRATDLWLSREAPDWETEHGLLRAALALSDMMDAAGPVMHKSQQLLHTWTQTLTCPSSRESISTAEALSRIDILYSHSDTVSDSSHQEILSAAYRRYKQHLNYSTLPATTQLLLLDMEQRGVSGAPFDLPLLDALHTTTCTHLGHHTPAEDEYWTLLSVVAESSCLQHIYPTT